MTSVNVWNPSFNAKEQLLGLTVRRQYKITTLLQVAEYTCMNGGVSLTEEDKDVCVKFYRDKKYWERETSVLSELKSKCVKHVIDLEAFYEDDPTSGLKCISILESCPMSLDMFFECHNDSMVANPIAVKFILLVRITLKNVHPFNPM